MLIPSTVDVGWTKRILIVPPPKWSGNMAQSVVNVELVCFPDWLESGSGNLAVNVEPDEFTNGRASSFVLHLHLYLPTWSEEWTCPGLPGEELAEGSHYLELFPPPTLQTPSWLGPPACAAREEIQSRRSSSWPRGRRGATSSLCPPRCSAGWQAVSLEATLSSLCHEIAPRLVFIEILTRAFHLKGALLPGGQPWRGVDVGCGVPLVRCLCRLLLEKKSVFQAGTWDEEQLIMIIVIIIMMIMIIALSSWLLSSSWLSWWL